MRRLFIYITVIVLFCACNDEWKEELYIQMVSLKAPINSDEVSAIYVRYQPEGKVTYKLPVIVSGSNVNERDLYVRIGIDRDTLQILNETKYSTREDLYYLQLPDSYVEFPSPTCHIPPGSSLEMFNINFNFEGLDLVEKWVLPLTIEDEPSYKMNRRKGWNKALLRIFPFNDYSGTYGATGMNINFREETESPMNVGSRTALVVDENTIFFYAGITEEKSVNRAIYKMKVTFEEPDSVDADGEITGKLTIGDNPDINLKLLSQPTYKITEEMDAVKPYLLHRYITLYMEYQYDDITSSEGDKELTYTCKGSMILERKINTLIPDEDQAIEWN
ncbi:MAG: DUF4973 domain-containing protein [Tannerellaceae bacterium]|nr:DUF4973 domain-containing protein [Tannerellaceae bacterium]